jgi:FkbM family methyltransferase
MKSEDIRELKEVWIYGGGSFANELQDFLQNYGIRVIGRITRENFRSSDATGGRELYSANPGPVLIGVFNHRDDPMEIVEFLESQRITDIVSPATIINSFHEINFSKYYLNGDLVTHPHLIEDLDFVKNNLFDDESRLILEGFISYQTTGDLSKIKRSSDASEQYLGKTLPVEFSHQWLTDELRWLDVGAFDGDTLRGIYHEGRGSESDRFLCIEPDRINFQKLSTTVQELEVQAELLNIAVGAEAGKIQFMHQGTLSSHLNNQSSKSEKLGLVSVLTVDQICKDFKPTHIKMDIEGAEMSALAGAERTLVSYRPKLAISLYHLPYDVTQIPIYLMTLLKNYAWFIRCYGAHGYDTILYGIPLE